MIEGVTRSELASLEPIVGAWMGRGWIPEACIQTLYFLLGNRANAPTVQRAALLLLCLLAQHDPNVLRGRLEGLLQMPLVDPVAIEWTCRGLEKTLNGGRLPSEHALLAWLEERFLLQATAPAWLQCTSQIVRTVYRVAERPEQVASRLVQRLCQQLSESNEFNGGFALIKLVQLAGEIAQLQAQQLEMLGKGEYSQVNKSEMEQIGATAEEELAERLRAIRDLELLGHPAALLSHLAPLVGHLCQHHLHYPSLQPVATLALARLMTVSGPYCQQQLPLLLAHLEHSPLPAVRANLCVALGDLIRSHGSLLESAYPCLFARLQTSEHLLVRRQALTVITHLSLTGMIKVKGRLGEIALCLLDAAKAEVKGGGQTENNSKVSGQTPMLESSKVDSALSSLARVFFTEMASKDPAAIYNHLPDVISCLGQTEVGEGDYEHIMRFILGLIKKDRQMEGLVGKLCARFPLTDQPRHWRQLSLCLSLLPMLTDRPVRKLIESLPMLQPALQDRQVWRHLTDIVNKGRRANAAASTEMNRAIIDELEQALVQAHDGMPSQQVTGITQDLRRMSLDAVNERKPARPPKTRKPKWEVEDEEDSDERGKLNRQKLERIKSDSEGEGEGEGQEERASKPIQSTRPRRSVRK